MKIGILTFHSGRNFGANLQSLAVQQILRSRGYDPIIIDYRDPWVVERSRGRVSSQQNCAHDKHISEYLNLSPRVSSEQELQEYCHERFDVIIVGSDQVFRLLSKWSPRLLLRKLLKRNASSFVKVNERLPVYWLPWSKEITREKVRISFAACAQGTSYFYLGNKLRNEACHSLGRFDFISVRDGWTKRIVNFLSQGKTSPYICPDPVFGLNECFDIPREEQLDVDVSNTILLAGKFGKKWTQEFCSIAHNQGFKVGSLPDPDQTFAFEGSDVTIELPLSPLAWYSLLSSCAGYVGSRYHGLVSCVANETPVVSIDFTRKPRLLRQACRKYDLCRKADAKSRYCSFNLISQPSPSTVLKKLFDTESQTSMNCYAKRARDKLNYVVNQFITNAIKR